MMSPRSNGAAARVCLISSGMPSTNPRLVKEARSLHDAGYDVTCVVGLVESEFSPFARSLIDSLGVKAVLVSRGARRTQLYRRIRQEAAIAFCKRVGFARSIPSWIFNAATSSETFRLKNAACKVAADIYIGHTVAALPATFYAARTHRAAMGFDAEDYHSAELSNFGRDRTLNEIARLIEDCYMPSLDHFSCSSPFIGREYEIRFGKVPLTLLNVFPKALSEGLNEFRRSKSVRPTFYWFSQTIGPGRGLEFALNVFIQLGRPVEVHLRGRCSESYKRHLLQIVYNSQVEVLFLKPEHPDKMVELACGYSAGLALEQTEPRNRDLCLTNKAFTYILAGTPVIFSPTTAQCGLVKEFGEAAVLLDSHNPADCARKISNLLDFRSHSGAREVAWDLGQSKYNWDVESKKFLASVRSLV